MQTLMRQDVSSDNIKLVGDETSSSLDANTRAVSTHDEDDDEDRQLMDEMNQVKLAPDFERVDNQIKVEKISHSHGKSSIAADLTELGPVLPDEDTTEEDNGLQLMGRLTSMTFNDLTAFEPLQDMDHMITFKDKAGNTAFHHAAFIGLPKTLHSLQEYARLTPHLVKSSRWIQNAARIVPRAILDGVATISPATIYDASVSIDEARSSWRTSYHLNLPVPVRGRDELPFYALDLESANLYRNLVKRNLGQKQLGLAVVKAVFRTAKDYRHPSKLDELVSALQDMDNELSMSLAEEAVKIDIEHARVYKAIALLDAGFGWRAAQAELDLYLRSFTGNRDDQQCDPTVFFVVYSILKDQADTQSKYKRLCASDALSCLRAFPEMESLWLLPEVINCAYFYSILYFICMNLNTNLIILCKSCIHNMINVMYFIFQDDVDIKVKAEGIDEDGADEDDEDDDEVLCSFRDMHSTSF